MKFSTREDIEAPIDYVFAQITDFEGFEKQAMRRGTDMQRADNAAIPGEGSSWDIAFKYRGKDRKMNAKISRLDAPNELQLTTVANGLDGNTSVELVALSRARTRISIAIELKPQSLSARLLLQSLKLAKSNLTRKFKIRVADFSEGVEESYRKSV